MVSGKPASAVASKVIENVRFGLLVVRRRAYHFHNGNKKRRKRKTMDADAAPAEEE